MYILSQNRSLLMEFGRIEVSRNLASRRDEKFVLSAWSRGAESSVIIGMFPDEESAEAELANIVAALNAAQPVYAICEK